MELKIGIKHRLDKIAIHELTATALERLGLPVFATPFMISMMEGTSMELLQPYMDEGYTSVGTRVEVSHLAPTLPGEHVYTTAELIELDGRRLVFAVEAYNDHGIIGKGRHERHIVKVKSFMDRAKSAAQPVKLA